MEEALFLREQKLILQAVSEFPEAKEPEGSLLFRAGRCPLLFRCGVCLATWDARLGVWWSLVIPRSTRGGEPSREAGGPAPQEFA